jgi:hypothetical protein
VCQSVRQPKEIKPVVVGIVTGESAWTYTYYVNDVQGNILAMYQVVDESPGYDTETFTLTEQYIYGGSMLGSYEPNQLLATYDEGTTDVTNETVGTDFRILGLKKYTLENHVSSVLVTVSKKTSSRTGCYQARGK